MMGLTKKQSECFEFIKQNIRTHGIAPSFEDMMEHLGLKSRSGVHRLLTALEERGYIRRLPHRARAIALTEDDVTDAPKWDLAAVEIMRTIREADRQHLSRTKALKEISEIVTAYRRGRASQ